MKIIKPPKQEDPREIMKRMALEGCDKCPYCKSKDITELSELCERSSNDTHFFWVKDWNYKEFHCNDCGCEYASDPYNIRVNPNDNRGIGQFASFAFGITFLFIFFATGRVWWTCLLLGIPLILWGIISCILTSIVYKKYLPAVQGEEISDYRQPLRKISLIDNL